jgi:hypothetical protein
LQNYIDNKNKDSGWLLQFMAEAKTRKKNSIGKQSAKKVEGYAWQHNPLTVPGNNTCF